jgi:hypothetical protein
VAIAPNIAKAIGEETTANASGDANATNHSVAIQGAKAIAVNTDGCCNGDGTAADATSLSNAANYSKAISNATAIAVDTAIPGEDFGNGANATAESNACTDPTATTSLGTNCFAYSDAKAVAKDTGAADAISLSNATYGGTAVTTSKAKATGGVEVVGNAELVSLDSQGPISVICPQPADQTTCAPATDSGYLPSNATAVSTANALGDFNLAVSQTDSSATNGGNANTMSAMNAMGGTGGFGVAINEECTADGKECAKSTGVVATNGTAGAAIGQTSATSNTAGGAANATVGGSTVDDVGPDCQPQAPVITSNIDPVTGKKTTQVLYNTGGVCVSGSASTAQPVLP